MRRREFVAALESGAAVWSAAVQAQPRIYRVGILSL